MRLWWTTSGVVKYGASSARLKVSNQSVCHRTIRESVDNEQGKYYCEMFIESPDCYLYYKLEEIPSHYRCVTINRRL